MQRQRERQALVTVQSLVTFVWKHRFRRINTIIVRQQRSFALQCQSRLNSERGQLNPFFSPRAKNSPRRLCYSLSLSPDQTTRPTVERTTTELIRKAIDKTEESASF